MVTMNHAFDGVVEEIDYGRMRYWVIYAPRDMEQRAPFRGATKLRMRGNVGGKPVALAWQRKDERHYLLFGKATARSLGLSLGSTVRVEFTIVSDDDVVVPAELRELFRQEPELRARWKRLTPGQQRGVAHRIASAKRPETRAQRAVDAMRSIENGVIPGPPRAR